MGNIFLGGVTPLLKKGAHTPLQESDVPIVPENERTADIQTLFANNWAQEKVLPTEKQSLWRAILKSVGPMRLLFGLCLAGVASGCAIGPPLILKAFSDHFSGQKELDDSILWILVVLLLALPSLSSVCMAHSYVFFSHAACMARNILTPTVFNKALRIGSNAKVDFSTGKIINLFSVDVFHIQMFFQNFGGEVFAPAQLGVALGLVYREVGVAMFAALGFVIAILPLLLVSFIYFAKYRQLKNIPGDERIKLTNEVLSGIRIIKYYSWEKPFYATIEMLRNSELSFLLKMNLTLVLIVMLITSIPFILPIVIFSAYTTLNNQQLDIGKAFTTLALLGLVSGPMSMIPAFIQRYYQAKISMGRIFEFFQCEELQHYIEYDQDADGLGGDVIQLEGASLSWVQAASAVDAAALDGTDPTDYAAVAQDNIELQHIQVGEEQPSEVCIGEGAETSSQPLNRGVHTLSNISLSVKPGELVAIIGGVGSGKTSLLCGLLGDMMLQSGSVRMRQCKMAYHAQQPWILNSNVRDNILFGLPYDKERFNKAVDASCLQSDLDILPNGVETEIGEKGINLSGGQKARVSFARAVYRDADIYLLDDPLSAVDAHVGARLFEHGICGALKGKTVILVTHQVHLLDKCDRLVVLKDGVVQSQGTPAEVKNAGIDLSEVVAPVEEIAPVGSPSERHNRAVSAASSAGRGHSATTSPVVGAVRKMSGVPPDLTADVIAALDAHGTRSRSQSLTSEAIEIISHAQNVDSLREKALDVSKGIDEGVIELLKSDSAKSLVFPVTVDDKKPDYEALMTTEERSIGEVPLEVYSWYAHLGGIGSAALSFVISLVGAGCYAYSSFWLADWGTATTRSFERDHEPLSSSENEFYLYIYALFSVLSILSSCSRTTVLVYFGVSASRKMHNLLLDGMLRSPISFFDSTPLGRILNRFTSDITNTDESLATNISFTLAMQSAILASIGAISYSTKGVLVILFVPLAMVFYQVQLYFRKANTELKRLDNISRSPIYTQFDQALVGVTSLRAYDSVQQFLSVFETSVDLNSSVVVLQQLVKWWISIRLEVIGGLVSCFIAALAVGWDGFLSDKYLSMSLNFSFALVSNMKWLVSISAEVEANMSSVERIKFYSDHLAVEESDSIAEKYKDVPEEWPQEGRIVAADVCMSYRTGPPVLKGLDFVVDPMEKIGIVGRTGCGKSSLMVALFRIENLSRGTLRIDGIDISSVPLHVLRSRLGIIPQDPVIFSVTVRFNLDPFDDFTDTEIWSVLESVGMKDAILSLPNKLQESVSDGGGNFSSGQRQLICIARVLLRKPKILVMDEATASVDNDTDALIQDMVRSQFKGCTVLTIAHRLHTVVDSDRIMVLNAGKLEEYDGPNELLADPAGMFSSLWKQHVDSHAEEQ